MDGFPSFYPRSTSSSQLLGKEKLARLARASCTPVRKHMDGYFHQDAMSRELGPQGETQACAEEGAGRQPQLRLLTSHTHAHTQRSMGDKKAQRSLNLPPGFAAGDTETQELGRNYSRSLTEERGGLGQDCRAPDSQPRMLPTFQYFPGNK